MIFRQLFEASTSTFTYLLADESSRETVLIDPVLERVDEYLALLDEMNLKLEYTLDTHVHADHVTGAGLLRKKTGCNTGISAHAGIGCADLLLREGATIHAGSLNIRVLETPGHTPTCLSYVVDGQQGSGTESPPANASADESPAGAVSRPRTDANFEHDMVFTGDSLLIDGCGRTDFQDGDAGLLYDSISQKLFTLPDSTVVYPGHDYHGRKSTTIGEQKQNNPRLQLGRDAFIQFMDELKLPMPKHIQEAVPANLACGQQHAA